MNGLDLISLVANTGGVLGLAIFTMFMLDRVWKDRCAAIERYAADVRSMWDQTKDVVEANTMAMTRLMEKLDRDSPAGKRG